jgi:hypothetical protein
MFARRRWYFPGRLTQNPDHPNLPELYEFRINWARTPVVLRPTVAVSLFVLAQQLAGLPIEKVHPRACRTGNRLILVFRRVLIIIQPMLDLHRCCWASEKERGHRLYIRLHREVRHHDLAQGS